MILILNLIKVGETWLSAELHLQVTRPTDYCSKWHHQHMMKTLHFILIMARERVLREEVIVILLDCTFLSIIEHLFSFVLSQIVWGLHRKKPWGVWEAAAPSPITATKGNKEASGHLLCSDACSYSSSVMHRLTTETGLLCLFHSVNMQFLIPSFKWGLFSILCQC